MELGSDISITKRRFSQLNGWLWRGFLLFFLGSLKAKGEKAEKNNEERDKG